MTISRDARLLYSDRVQYDAFIRSLNTVARVEATRIANTEIGIAMDGVVLLEGAQTVNGAKTFTSTLSAPSVVEGGTALGSKYAAIGHDHAGVYQPVDGDLTAIAALAGTSGLARKTAANTWALDTNVYLTSFTETDPVFLASAAAGIATLDITNWNTAFGWGDHAGLYEPTFSKNTAFNKNFGSAIDTVCQGNDARLSDARTPLAHTHVVSEITDFNPADYLPLAGGTLSGSLTQGAGGWVTKAGSSGDNASRELLNFYDDRTDRYASIGTWRGAASTRIGLSFWGSFDAAPVERMRLNDSGHLVMLGGDFYLGSGTMQSGTVPWARLSGIPATFTPSAHTHVEADITDLQAYALDSAVVKLSGTQTITGQKVFEYAAGNTLVTIQKNVAGNQAVLDFRDDAGVQRNIFGLAGGTNDDFFIGRYNDAGVWQGSVMYVPAATGIADFQYTPTAGGVALSLSTHTHTDLVALAGAQTISGQKTFSSAPRTHRAAADMVELWRTDASADDGRWVFQVGADGAFDLLGLTDAAAAGQLAMRIARTGAALVPAVNLYANGVVTLATQQYNTGDNSSGALVRHRNGSFYDVGMNVMPIIQLDGADLTLSSAHVGGIIRKWDTVARNLNIPASPDTDIPIGARFEYAGWNPGAVTLNAGAGMSLSWLTGAGTTTGTPRTLATGSQVTIVRMDATRWMVWGIGIT